MIWFKLEETDKSTPLMLEDIKVMECKWWDHIQI